MFKSIIGATCTCLAVVSLNVNAALVSRLGGLAYYDTEADLTWLADANAGAGSAFDNNVIEGGGMMNWASANAWAASLEVAGITGWRLADSNTIFGVDTDSEMGNLFYNVLGGVVGSSLLSHHNTNYDLFDNIQGLSSYWTATRHYVRLDTAWSYDFSLGVSSQYTGNITNGYYAWALHDGDIGAVPVPAAVWLFGSGLIGLIGFARRKA